MNDTALITRPETPLPEHRRPRRGRGWATAGLVFMTTAALCGGYVAYAWAQTSTRTEHATVGGQVTSLVVTGDTVHVQVVPVPTGQSPGVDARLTDRDRDASWTHELRGSQLVVDADCRNRLVANFCSVDLTVRVPEGTPVSVHTSTGDVTVTGLAAAAEVETSTGDITVDGARERLRLQASTGDITARNVDVPDVTATTSTGDLTLDFAVAPRQTQVQTSTGDVQVTVPGDEQPYRVQVDTSVGEVRVDVPRAEDADRRITAKTSTGDITVR